MPVANLRPSPKEIDKRLCEAKKSVERRRVAFANEIKLVGELMSLGIDDTDEVWDLIEELLDELRLEDYVGGHPPKRSYEPKIANRELWAFCWDSKKMNECMYLKFALKEDCF